MKKEETESEPRCKKTKKDTAKMQAAPPIGKRKACRCGSLTHQRTNSLQCPQNKICADASPDVIAGFQQDAEEQAALDNPGEAHLLVARATTEDIND